METTEIAPENVIAYDVPFEAWMAQYSEARTEWVKGMVIKLSPISRRHDILTQFFILLLRNFLKRTGLGQVMVAPFVMKIAPESSAREPDLHIVLNERAGIIQDTMTAGPADVVIEIVSVGTQQNDLITKYEEYEAGGVREYWIINPLREQSDFYLLGENRLYRRIELKEGVFHSSVLAGFSLNTGLLWDEDVLQDVERIQRLVEAMLKGS